MALDPPVLAAPDCGLVPERASSADLSLSSVESLDVDSRGRIYVGDRLRSSVAVLSSDGRLIRTVGRAGGGPGEFGYIRNVQVLPGDSLMVYDTDHYRVSVFAPDSGKVAYVQNFAGGPGATPPNGVQKLPGQRAFLATHRAFYAASGDPADRKHAMQAVRLVEWNGATRRDSVIVVPASQPLVAREGGMMAVTTDPFGRPGLVRVGPEGRIYYGWGDSLRIDVYSLRGERVGGFALPHAGPPVTPADVEAASQDVDPMLQRAMRAGAPERWPAFQSFLVDEQGRAWVGVVTPRGAPTRWTVFEDDGRVRCVAPLPASVDLRVVRGGRAYGVETDEMDVPRIVVYRVGAGDA